MSNEYPYEVRDPQRSMEWTAVDDTWNAWASVRAFLKINGYKPREFVDAPRIFEVRHPRTDPAAIDEVRVSVPLRTETHVRRRGFDKWALVGRTTAALAERDALLTLLDRVDYDGKSLPGDVREDIAKALDAARKVGWRRA